MDLDTSSHPSGARTLTPTGPQPLLGMELSMVLATAGLGAQGPSLSLDLALGPLYTSDNPSPGLTSSRKSAGVFVPPGPLCSVPPALPTLQPLLKFTEASGLLIAGPLQGPCPSFSRSHRKV